MLRLALVLSVVALVGCAGTPKAERAEPGVTRIAFGSCAKQNKPQPIWDAVNALGAEVFILLGDNVYGDTEDMGVLRRKYARQNAVPGFKALRESGTVLIGTWDDHDYGANDAGAEYPMKAESQQVMLDFFEEPADSWRRKTPGVYASRRYTFPGSDRIVQVILLDTRYFRSELVPDPDRKRGEPGGPYHAKHQSGDGTVLGEAQWKWLESALRTPADVRIIATSIQFVADQHGWEKWANFPHERDRLIDLIDQTGANGVVFISGDRHTAELSRLDRDGGYPLYDITSSSLNAPLSERPEANRHRIGDLIFQPNFGLIEIDWRSDDPLITMQVRGVDGNVRAEQRTTLRQLTD